MKTKLLSIDITILSYEETITQLLAISANGSSYTCVANVHMLVEAYNDPNFASIVNNADFVTADGMPLSHGLNLLYGIKQERIAGMDLLPSLLKQAEVNSIPVFFYGGTDTLLSKSKKYISKHFPLLNLAGLYSPPFRKLTETEDNEVVDRINNSGAKFVFVVLGCPKQEKWMGTMKGRINAHMIGIGGALPVMIGAQKRAPKWMQKSELEWLFRLMQEPKRLFRRYAITNTVFIWLLISEWARQGFKRS